MISMSYGSKIINIPKDLDVFQGVDTTKNCWEKHCSEKKRKYPYFTIRQNRRSIKVNAHRLVYTLVKGKIPNGLHVCHSCDNYKCINPNHLFAETPSKNRLDAYKRNRQFGVSKLNNEQRETIYFFGKTPKRGQSRKILAKIFGITYHGVNQIINRIDSRI